MRHLFEGDHNEECPNWMVSGDCSLIRDKSLKFAMLKKPTWRCKGADISCGGLCLCLASWLELLRRLLRSGTGTANATSARAINQLLLTNGA
jgi:hypothetical protein